MTGQWDSFFTTEVGAAAALTGLVFVALSINLARIMQLPALVGRAAEALLLLVQPVAFGLTLLAPYGHVVTGVMTLFFGVAFAATLTVLLTRGWPPAGDPIRRQYRVRAVFVAASVAGELVGSALLVGGSSASFGWIGFGALACVAVGIVDAWVLLVEILR
jgi:modulator of FtsH protease